MTPPLTSLLENALSHPSAMLQGRLPAHRSSSTSMTRAILEAVECFTNRHSPDADWVPTASNNPRNRPTDKPPHPRVSRAHEQHHRCRASRARTLMQCVSREEFRVTCEIDDSRSVNRVIKELRKRLRIRLVPLVMEHARRKDDRHRWEKLGMWIDERWIEGIDPWCRVKAKSLYSKAEQVFRNSANKLAICHYRYGWTYIDIAGWNRWSLEWKNTPKIKDYDCCRYWADW